MAPGGVTVPAGEDPRLWVNPADWVHGEFPANPDPGDDVAPRFYLGAPHAHWLAQARVPLFVSHNTLKRQTDIRPARAPWALDSGGFTELSTWGEWRTSPREYAQAICRYALRDRYGMLQWAAPQDWMGELAVRVGGKLGTARYPGTGLSVAEHLDRTVRSVLELRALLRPEGLDHLIIPVLQGSEDLDDYRRCAELYAINGIDLASERIVGLGSVCRRQDSSEVLDLARELAGQGIRLHGFGVSRRGLAQLAPYLTSADSMAWSLAARMAPAPIHRDCTHRRCVCCPRFAMQWRQSLLADLRAWARPGPTIVRGQAEFDAWAAQWRVAA
jgi:hypothetical protein